MKYCQYLCETCIIFFIAASPSPPTHFAIFLLSFLEILNFAGEGKQQFGLTIIGFKAAVCCLLGC
jgi:hypothetical protein